MHALQHEGQDSAGIVTSNNRKFFAHRGMGQVSDVFSNREIIPKLIGRLSIGALNRYGTTGESTLKNVQPLFSELDFGGIAIAHNGNLTNTNQIKEKLIRMELFFNLHLTQGNSSFDFNCQGTLIDRIVYAFSPLLGHSLLVLLTNDSLIEKMKILWNQTTGFRKTQ